jgi:CRP-like cAMP-binding protein
MSGLFGSAVFKGNSFIVLEGKAANFFYIIRQGKVRLTPEIPIPEEEANTVLNPGDFFGVVACMSGQAQIETVQSITDCSLITVGRDQFGVLIQKNAPIALKIIRYFSQRLRIIDKAITKLNFQYSHEEDHSQIFHVGKFYFDRHEYAHAIYAFRSYLRILPHGENADECHDLLKQMDAPDKPADQKDPNQLAQSFDDGELIMIEHEPGDTLYIIQKGQVKITKVVNNNEVMLAVLNPGDIFGEMAILENKPRSASAVAFGGMVALAINKANFESMVKQQPQLAVKLITILSERIWTAFRRMANLLIGDSVGRSYDLLLTQVHKNQVTIRQKSAFEFDFGINELNKMLGLGPKDGNEHVNVLIKDKNIKIDQGRITVLDLSELEKLAAYHRKRVAMDKKREQAKLR